MATLSDPQENTRKQPRQLSNFTVRYLTALAFLPLGIAGMFIGGILWALMMLPLGVVGGLEFYSLAHNRPNQGIASVGIPAILMVMLGFYLEEPALWLAAPVVALVAAFAFSMIKDRDVNTAFLHARTTLIGVLYIGFPVAFLIGVGKLENSFLWLAVIFGITWGTDTMAYAGGRMWGKRKLAPKLSPNKTIEGAIVGIIGGTLPPLLFLLRADEVSLAAVVMIIFGPFVAIAGDLFESALKRHYEVKDSHLSRLNLIPGHGGVLDRVDALLMVTTYCYLFILLTGITA